MRGLAVISAPLVLAACGGDAVSSETAALSAQTSASRATAQAGRIDNPEALACVRANASEGEWAIIAGQDSRAEAELRTVLDRQSTIQCFNNNSVVVYQ